MNLQLTSLSPCKPSWDIPWRNFFVQLSHLKSHNVKISDTWWQLTYTFVIRIQISTNPQISIVQDVCICVEWFTFIEHLFHLVDLSFQVTCTLLHIHSLQFYSKACKSGIACCLVCSRRSIRYVLVLDTISQFNCDVILVILSGHHFVCEIYLLWLWFLKISIQLLNQD